jgi:hypothetical protein
MVAMVDGKVRRKEGEGICGQEMRKNYQGNTMDE